MDGAGSGGASYPNVTHTNGALYDWWQVDLGASYSIATIDVANRTDCCGERLADYWVFVSDTPFTAGENPLTLPYRAGTFSTHQVLQPNPTVTIPLGGVTGRYVRCSSTPTTPCPWRKCR